MRTLKHTELSTLHQMAAQKGSHPLNVAIYARKSREDASGSSLSRQIQTCMEMINKNETLFTMHSVYQEDDVSGMSLDKREELSKLRKKVQEKTIDVVLVSHFDRLARDLVNLQTLIKEFNDNGITLIAGDDHSDNSAAGILQKQMQFAVNEFLVRRSVEDVKQTHANKAKEGYTVGGPGNYGYMIHNRKYVINPKEAEAVKKIFEWTLQGKSYRQIADDLEAQGFQPRKAKRFSPSFIKSVLTNPRNAGKSVWNAKDKRKHNMGVLKQDIDEVISEAVVKEAIIDQVTFDRVQAIVKQRTNGKSNKEGTPYMLTGIIKCGVCGGRITGNSQRSGRNKTLYRTYHCKNHKGKHGKTCPTKPVRVEYVETQVKHVLHAYLKQSLRNQGINSKTTDAYLKSINQKQWQLKKRMVDHEHKIEDLVIGYHTETNERLKQTTKKLIDDAQDDKDHDETVLNNLNSQINHAQQSVNALNNGNIAFDVLFHSDLRSRELMHQCIESVTVTNETISIELKEE